MSARVTATDVPLPVIRVTRRTSTDEESDSGSLTETADLRRSDVADRRIRSVQRWRSHGGGVHGARMQRAAGTHCSEQADIDRSQFAAER